MSWAEIGSEDELRELLGEVMPRAATKERVRLHQRDRDWLAASPFCLIATSDDQGSCDVSPKGDPAGFVHVIDDTTIAVPDRPGNRRADGFRNILKNPHVGLIFLIPGRNETLRINGRARLVREAPFFDELIVKGHRPHLALVVEIEQIFFHCAKSFMRSALWKPDTWQPDVLPSHARLIKDVQVVEESVEELERYYGESYAEKLYAAGR
ncbi:pyridoxamine 5'-phosphate oxidase family protein [Nonomuraea sp. KC401]|uniref:pyridoxamine 5'-phosphate oxidase family protein n=1 Tax=unclassified Nonomuraea TaxID=2593643 RepID=UPI0010FCFE3B|nr:MULTISPECIES: pyridoxamine 5'-phosphate oxidase family protein [unclassified Nonomuraea]NBE99848.1 pyridoxamine 5'-phosphate oxidase family protein [Nonomuraea sp. K271]TLF55341.1 pyridoxamine 5'-phosphate oxidase family protein [Nonomuraea sp. KC401]